MDEVSLRVDVTNISSYWLSLLLSALPPVEWGNRLGGPSQDVASVPFPFPPVLLSGVVLLLC